MNSRHWILAMLALGGAWQAVQPALAQNWTPTSAPKGAWACMAGSADAVKLVAAINSGPIYISTDSGVTWTPSGTPNTNWSSVASSADGTTLVAAAPGYYFAGMLCISTNSGASWTQVNTPARNWCLVASSASGTRLAAAAPSSYNGPGGIYISTNSGATWILTSAPSGMWTSLVSSPDGTTLLVTEYIPALGHYSPPSSSILTSTDAGLTWSRFDTTPAIMPSAAFSSDGSKLVVVGCMRDGGILTSTNSGASWMSNSAPLYLNCVALSADGSRLVAGAWPGGLYTSSDSGLTWSPGNAPNPGYWSGVVCSADGDKLLAVNHGGFIYTTGGVPPLTFIVSDINLILSWIDPSNSFTLQESPDLTSSNWTPVVQIPSLNPTDLYRVVLPMTNRQSFYRLKGP